MDHKLLAMFVDNGLVQFGRFEKGGDPVPILLHFDLLPSYPDVLKYIADQMAPHIGTDVERIVCSADSLALGTALSLQTQIPLVYSRGRGEAPVYDLVGAYDVGHPAVLVMNVLDGESRVPHFIGQATKVGLHIHRTVAITSLSGQQTNDYQTAILVPLATMVNAMEQEGIVTTGQANAVRQWINR